MKLKYVGPKPHISQHGIVFDNNKEDKYIYLSIVVQLLNALNHEYYEDRVYVYEADTSRVDDSTLLHDLTKYCPEIDSLVDKRTHNVEDELQDNISRAHDSNALSPEESEVLTKNIEIMHDYIIQRSINKSVYYCAIAALAKLLKKDNIDHIIAPMYQNFVHVFHSVQGVLEKEKFPIDTNIDIYKENDKLLVKLQIINT